MQGVKFGDNLILMDVVLWWDITSPPFSLLEEAQGGEKMQAVEVVVDSQLQEVIL